jgi:oligosaccharyltransferase complex subunit gamma
MTVSTIILGVITLVSVAAPYVLPIVQNRNVWAVISLILILMFTSGHMFNHIRKVPYVGGDGKGGMSYFAGGFSNQFGMETQIVAAMCKSSPWPLLLHFSNVLYLDGILSFATIFLAVKVPRMSDPRKQQVAVWIWAAVLMGMYSFLLSVFRIKNGGYPFWLPPF